MVAGLEPARPDRMKGRAMWRNLLGHARLLMLAVGTVEACRFLHLPVWSWIDPALSVWSRAIGLGVGVLVAWNMRAFLNGAPERVAMRAKEADLKRAKELLSAYPPPLAQPGNAMQKAALQAAIVQGMTSMAARPGQPSRLRYMLPPLITVTGPQTPHDGVNYVTPSTRRLTGACGKCGQPMGAHSYYGSGPCQWEPPQAVVHVRACKACGDLMLLGDDERDVVYCGPCGPQGI